MTLNRNNKSNSPPTSSLTHNPPTQQHFFYLGRDNLAARAFISALCGGGSLTCSQGESTLNLPKYPLKTHLVFLQHSDIDERQTDNTLVELTRNPAIKHVLLVVRANCGPLQKYLDWPIVKGFMDINIPQHLALKAVNTVLDGGLWFPHKMLEEFLVRKRQHSSDCPQCKANRITRKRSNVKLTQQEKKILLGLVTGITNTKLANQMSISTHTMKTHLSNIYRKIEVPNKTMAVVWANEHLVAKSKIAYD